MTSVVATLQTSISLLDLINLGARIELPNSLWLKGDLDRKEIVYGTDHETFDPAPLDARGLQDAIEHLVSEEVLGDESA